MEKLTTQSQERWVLFVSVCLATFGTPSCSTSRTTGPGHGAAAQPSPDGQSSAIAADTVYVSRPGDFVQSGLDANLHLKLTTVAMMSASAAADQFSPAISVSDSSGNRVPTRVTGSFDNNGATINDIVAITPQALNAWYTIVVTPIPGSVVFQGFDRLTLNVYTGDLVYVESLSQGTDPAKQDSVWFTFTQPVNFDASWAGHVLADADGNAISACYSINNKCVTSGSYSGQYALLLLPVGTGAKLGRFIPDTMKAAYGHPALALPLPDGSSPAIAEPLPDGSLPIKFQDCEQPGERCAFF